MRKQIIFLLFGLAIICAILSFKSHDTESSYSSFFFSGLKEFENKQQELLSKVFSETLNEKGIESIRLELNKARLQLKSLDFWLRYLEPLSYKKINGPLPVEWETEVFEKFEKPYRREGSGLTLAGIYLGENNPVKDSLIHLIQGSIKACKTFYEDSITNTLKSFDHFFYCNRLFLLNLAAIYTTGFECPDSRRVIPELKAMVQSTKAIYSHFNSSFPVKALSPAYINLYDKMLTFVGTQSDEINEFDHFILIKDYINPLFEMNQCFIQLYGAVSRSVVDYSLDKNCRSIFSKNLYHGQNTKGVYLRIQDVRVLNEIEMLGRSLFYDPILSGDNRRSCASCHKPDICFTDTVMPSAYAFDKKGFLPRNTPSLLNADYNHLLMLDGKHISLHDQAVEVITNPLEMGCAKSEILKKVLSCSDYKNRFGKLLTYLPEEKEVTLQHITSALIYYYSRFSRYYSPFDKAMNNQETIGESAKKGFNLFMGKAQCGTCHFVPQFNGVKPPYVGSEFEVLGVPADTLYSGLSKDYGRHKVNPASETLWAFRTGTIRNASRTKPYMHNGVFNTLELVLEFYNTGGGEGHGLSISNQTLSSDSLGLNQQEKKDLLTFISSLNEDVPVDTKPKSLPKSKNKLLNKRIPGGEY